MKTIIKEDNYLKVLLSLSVPLILMFIKPIEMTLEQSIILGSLFLTIIWWGTGWVYKDVASMFLLIIFIIFGNTPIKSVFFFPLSSNFILVISSYLLSQGIVNSNVADNFSSFILSKYCYNSKRLVIMSFILGILLIFVIPQPFPRVILLASIYINFLKNTSVNEENKRVLIFSVFVASAVTSLMFLNGDVIINYSAMKFGGINLSYLEWAKYMALPTLVTSAIILISFLLLFRKNLNDKFNFEKEDKLVVTKSGKKALLITALVVILWLTETLHGISSANVALLGTLLMFVAQIIKIRDLKVINVSLLIFLTAEFAIGKVLLGSGVAEKLSDSLIGFFPSAESIMYIPFIVFLIMFLHMIMGSLVTAISVLIPTLITLTAGNLSTEFIVLLTCASVCFHFILPFHHVSIMIGYGNGYYENRHTIKMGVALSAITVLVVLFIYIPWWKMFGIV